MDYDNLGSRKHTNRREDFQLFMLKQNTYIFSGDIF